MNITIHTPFSGTFLTLAIYINVCCLVYWFIATIADTNVIKTSWNSVLAFVFFQPVIVHGAVFGSTAQ